MFFVFVSVVKMINVDDVDDWIVVKDDCFIEKGWGFLFFGKENEVMFEFVKRKCVDKMFIKYGYVKMRLDVDDMIKDGCVCVGGVLVECELCVLLLVLIVDGKVFVSVKRRAGTFDDDDDDDNEWCVWGMEWRVYNIFF